MLCLGRPLGVAALVLLAGAAAARPARGQASAGPAARGVTLLTSYDAHARQSLRGWKTFRLLISHPTNAVQAGVVDSAALRTRIELALRERGVVLAPITDPKADAIMIVRVDALGVEIGNQTRGWSYYVDVSFSQPTTVERQPELTILGTTWERSKMGLAGTSSASNQIAEEVESVLRSFLNDWLAANPR